jgi:3-oxoacyl-[acyl-carrier protein] reductase
VRNVLVTGASRGLGLAIAAKLASSGYRVIAVARNEGDELPSIISKAETSGHGALHFRRLDLSDIDAIAGFIATTRNEFGPLYGLVNNAALGTPGILATMPDREIERLVRLNVHSPIVVTKWAIRSMMVGGSGRIVNISSVVGFTGYSGLSVYTASKAALLGFTRSLARELGPLEITVNSIAPGFLATAMTEELTGAHLEQIRRRNALHRLADVADVADAADYLFSERARNITGTTLTIDAGNTA